MSTTSLNGSSFFFLLSAEDTPRRQSYFSLSVERRRSGSTKLRLSPNAWPVHRGRPCFASRSVGDDRRGSSLTSSDVGGESASSVGSSREVIAFLGMLTGKAYRIGGNQKSAADAPDLRHPERSNTFGFFRTEKSPLPGRRKSNATPTATPKASMTRTYRRMNFGRGPRGPFVRTATTSRFSVEATDK
jgi:hypothetical protein